MTLFIDACTRNNSRTRELAQHLLDKFSDDIQTLELYKTTLPELDEKAIYERETACSENDENNFFIKLAKQFTSADIIVIAAPFWDLSFPAILKKYIEDISIVGQTFTYSPDGRPIGLCSAKKLYYVTTAGGKIRSYEYGYGYIKALVTEMFGISETECFSAENLDIIGYDADKIMKDAKLVIDNSFSGKENNNGTQYQ